MPKSLSEVIHRSKSELSQSLTRSKIRYLSRKLEISKLIEDEEENIFEQDSKRILGHYSEKGMDYIFKAYGLYKYLKSIGFGRLEIALEKCSSKDGRMFVYSVSPALDEPLIELVLEEVSIAEHGLAGKKILKIEWLMMQNPLSKKEVLLPGQKYAGLHCGRVFFELIQVLKWRLKFDRIVAVPRYFHNAFQYQGALDFIDLKAKESFERILKEFNHLSFHELSWKIANEELFFNNGEKVIWKNDLLIDRVIADSESS